MSTQPIDVEKDLTETEKSTDIWKKQLQLALVCLWMKTKPH